MKEQEKEGEDLEPNISKPNRRKNQEAAKSAQVVHSHLKLYEREEPRKEKERKTNLFVKKARKKANG